MSNKNVADYTDFDGKTNKKIVQAPGGASSMSLAWSNEKTDYGPERTYKKKETSGYAEQGKNYGLPQGTYGQHQNGYGPSQGYGQSQSYGQPQGYGQPPSYGSSNSYGQPQSYGKSQSSYEPQQPIRVMDSYEEYPKAGNGYSSKSITNQNPKKIGGQYGYNNYVGNYPQPEPYQANSYKQGYQQPVTQVYSPYQNPKGPKPFVPQTLDIAVMQYKKTPPLPKQANQMSQQSAQRPCVKIHEQKTSISLGDDSYNYWKDNDNERKGTNQSNRRSQDKMNPPVNQPMYQQPPQQKFSVKVKNPPGGKGSFILG